MGPTVISWARRSEVACDWSNSELAELYRVDHSLFQAGLRIETERGISDEGDPWFVFCHADGRVVVHIARVDGFYILDCPALPSPMKGTSFADLTKAFVSSAAQPRGVDPSGRVVAHPSALLSLLVAAAILSLDAVISHPAHASVSHSAHAGHASSVLASHFFFPEIEAAPAGARAKISEGFVKTFVGAVWRDFGPPEAQDAVWRAVESAALGFAAFSSETVASAVDSASTVSPPLAAEVSATQFGNPPQVLYESIEERGGSAEFTNHVSVASGVVELEGAAGLLGAAPSLKASSGGVPSAGFGEILNEVSYGGGVGRPGLGLFHTIIAPEASSEGAVAQVTLADGLAVAPRLTGVSQVEILLSNVGGAIDLGLAHPGLSIFVAGNGVLAVTHAETAHSIEFASGDVVALQLSYDGSSAPAITQTLALDGAARVSASVTPPSAATAPVSLVVDSQGAQANALNIVDAQPGAPTGLDLKIVGDQSLALSESSAGFNASIVDASGFSGALTVGVDLSSASAGSVALNIDGGDFIVNPQDNVALQNVSNDASIELGINLGTLIIGYSSDVSADGPIALSLSIGSPTPASSVTQVNLIDVDGVSHLSIVSSGGANGVHVILDSALTHLDLSGAGALDIGSIQGVGAGDAQAIFINAQAMTGALTLDASAIADTAAGGREVSISTGSAASTIVDTSTSESLHFAIGAGSTSVSIADGATLVAVAGLQASDQINVGAAAVVDSFVNGLTTVPPHQAAIDAASSVVAAAEIAATFAELNAPHQALLFSYGGDTYVFVDAIGNHVFSSSVDAIVKVIGASPTTDLHGVFHSA